MTPSLLRKAFPLASSVYGWTRPYLPNSFLSIQEKMHLQKFFEKLPSFLTISSMLAYEGSIKGGSEGADISLGLDPSSADLEDLEKFSSSQQSTNWNNLAHFIRWARDRDLFRKECIEILWLEFDVRGSDLKKLEPNIVLKLNENELSCEETLELARNSYFYLKNKVLSEKSLSSLRLSYHNGFKITALAFMLARPSDAIRFRVRNTSVLSISELSSYCKSISHPQYHSFLKLYGLVKPFLNGVCIYLGAEDQMLPRIDLIISKSHDLLREEKESWKRILRFLVQEKLVDLKKSEGLASYVGSQLEPTYSQAMEMSFSKAVDPEHTLLRGLGQIKFVIHPDRAIEAKAYLYVQLSHSS